MLLAALAVAGLATVWFVRSSGWKRVTWFSSHFASLGNCQTSTEARGATAAQAGDYCGCVLDTVERRWTPGQYQGSQRDRTCTKQRAVDGRTTEQADAYCRCILDVVEPRWSPADFRLRIDEAKRTLDQEGKRDACWASAGVTPAPVTP